MPTRVQALLATAAGLLLSHAALAQAGSPEPASAAQGRAFFVPAGSGATQPARRAPLAPAQRLERRYLQSTGVHIALQGEASRHALARGSTTAVRDLAQAVLARHAEVQPQLVRLLHARAMALPLTPDENRKLLRQMEKLQGPRLERLYVNDVLLRSLQAELAEHEQMAAQAGDEALRGWASQQLPAVRTLLGQAKAALPGGAARAAQRAL